VCGVRTSGWLSSRTPVVTGTSLPLPATTAAAAAVAAPGAAAAALPSSTTSTWSAARPDSVSLIAASRAANRRSAAGDTHQSETRDHRQRRRSRHAWRRGRSVGGRGRRGGCGRHECWQRAPLQMGSPGGERRQEVGGTQIFRGQAPVCTALTAKVIHVTPVIAENVEPRRRKLVCSEKKEIHIRLPTNGSTTSSYQEAPGTRHDSSQNSSWTRFR
jgi:hypothetical protein